LASADLTNPAPEAGILKSYCATNSGLPEVLSMVAHVVQILNLVDLPELFSLFLLYVSIEGRGLRSASGDKTSDLGQLHVHLITKIFASILTTV
jgi:hypothetical protein